MGITFDAAVASSLVNPAHPSHGRTCTGSNGLLVAGCIGDSTSNLVTGATYNGVAMTQIGPGVKTPGARWINVFWLVGPATGAHNIVVSASSSIVLAGVSASYTGVAQTGQPDTSTSSTGTTSPFTQTSLASVAANCWAIAMFNTQVSGASAGTGTTARETSFSMLLGDNSTAVAAATQVNLAVTATSSGFAGVIATFAPAASTTPTSGFLALL